ncbi:MAG: hypothetical protein ACOCV2_14715, partial [Persicimonas sp.]
MSSHQSFKETEQPSIERSVRNRHLWEYFAPYKKLFAIGALFLVATNVLNLAIPAYIGEAVEMMRESIDDVGDLSASRDRLIEIGLIIIALAIGGGIVRIFSRIFIFDAGRY